MALFEGTINQIENTQHKIDNIDKGKVKNKDYLDDNYPTVKAVAKYVDSEITAAKNDIKGTLNTKTQELQTNIDGKADKSTFETEISRLDDNKADKSELNTEISTLNTNKVDKIEGKGLSTEDFTTDLKDKLTSVDDLIEEELNTKAQELQTNIDKKADTSALNEAISTLNTNKLDKSSIITGTYEVTDYAEHSGGDVVIDELTHFELSEGDYLFFCEITYSFQIKPKTDYWDVLGTDYIEKENCVVGISNGSVSDSIISHHIKIKNSSTGTKLLAAMLHVNSDSSSTKYITYTIPTPKLSGNIAVEGKYNIKCDNIHIFKL